MTQQKTTPISTDKYRSDEGTIQATSPDLYEMPTARVEHADGESIEIPVKFLPLINRYASSLLSSLNSSRDEAMRSFLGLGADARLRPVPAGGRRGLGMAFSLADADMAVEGTPVLVWRPSQRDGEVAGWRLTLVGADAVTVSFARWDDAPALANLIDTMADQESVITIAGIVDPVATSRLSARQTAVAMRQARSLPSITLPRMRTVLTNAGLATDQRSRYEAGRMRLLTVNVGSMKVPAAVAVLPPLTPSWTRPMTAEEEALPYQARQALLNELRETARNEWVTRAQAAISAAGWRVVALPDPRGMWGRTGSVVWATRIDAETWSSLSAAVASAASELEMTRGAVI